jgi:hypothetical protein
MATKGIKIFFAIGLVFYIILGFYLGISINSIRDEELQAASAASKVLHSSVESAHAVEYSFSSDYFSGTIDEIFSGDQRLSAVIIYTEDDGPLFVRLNDSRILTVKPGTRSGWENGPPELSTTLPGLQIFNTALYPSTGSTIHLTSVYNLLDRRRFLPVLRNTLIAAVCYLALTVIFLSINKGSKPADFGKETIAEVSKLESAPIPVHNEEVDSSGLYSPKSGLVWEHFLRPKLSAELKRAASFDQDSCLVFISILSPSGFIPYRNISELIIEHFSYRDLAFESGDDTFCVIIPDKDLDEGLHEVEKFRKSIFSRFPDSVYKIYAGLTSRNSRLLSEKRMIQEAQSALSKAVSEPDSTTMSFRTDLNKYREYIASTI